MTLKLPRIQSTCSLLALSFALWGCSTEPIQHDTTKPPTETAEVKADVKKDEAVSSQNLVIQDQSPQLKPISTTPATEAPPAEPPPTAPVSAVAVIPKEEPKVVEKEAHQEAKNEEVKEAKKEEHKSEGQFVPAEKALGWLKNGNIRYTKNRLRADGASPKDRERLASGQKPHSIILSCSDSRVPPELIFDQKLGEIFVIRTAGESLDRSAIASIEYAVEHLNSKLILVMGHDSCGAVKATMQAVEGQSSGSASLDYLVSDLKPHLKDVWDGRHPGSENLTVEVKANAKGVAADLLSRSEIVNEKVKSGTLRIESAVYHLKSGQVEFN